MSDLNPRRGTKNHEGTRRKTKRKGTRRDTKTDGPPLTTSGTRILLQFCVLGVTMSWDEGFLGARASRPHQAWHSLGHLPHLDQPGTAPWLSFGLAAAVPADRVAACSIALKLSGGQRDSMRAGRPRSQAMPSRRCGGECLAGDFRPGGSSPDYQQTILYILCIDVNQGSTHARHRDQPDALRMDQITLHSPLFTLHSPLSTPQAG